MNTSNNKRKNKLVRTHFRQCSSTQDKIKSYIQSGLIDAGFSLYADFQSIGRGQRGSSWESPKDQNILVSYYFPWSNFLVENSFRLNICTSLAICDLIEHFLKGVNYKIKWPNDIYINNKKLAGILIQNQLKGNQILATTIGVGINVFYPRRHQTRTCLQAWTNIPIDMSEVREKYDFLLKSRMTSINGSLDEYNQLLWKSGEEVIVSEGGKSRELKIIKACENGKLEVRDSGQTRFLQFKEVKFIV